MALAKGAMTKVTQIGKNDGPLQNLKMDDNGRIMGFIEMENKGMITKFGLHFTETS